MKMCEIQLAIQLLMLHKKPHSLPHFIAYTIFALKKRKQTTKLLSKLCMFSLCGHIIGQGLNTALNTSKAAFATLLI